MICLVLSHNTQAHTLKSAQVDREESKMYPYHHLSSSQKDQARPLGFSDVQFVFESDECSDSPEVLKSTEKNIVEFSTLIEGLSEEEGKGFSEEKCRGLTQDAKASFSSTKKLTLEDLLNPKNPRLLEGNYELPFESDIRITDTELSEIRNINILSYITNRWDNRVIITVGDTFVDEEGALSMTRNNIKYLILEDPSGKVKKIKRGFLAGNHYIEHLVFRGFKNLKTVSSNFLIDCSGLESVDGLNSIQAAGERFFQSCKTLKNIPELNSLITIGDWAFNGCKAIESVDGLNNLKSIGHCSFMHLKSLKKIQGLNSLENLGECCFEYCPALEEAEGLKHQPLFQKMVLNGGTPYVGPQ